MADKQAGPSKTIATPAENTLPKKVIPPRAPASKYHNRWWFQFFGLETTAEILSFRPGRRSLVFALVAGPIAAGYVYDKKLARDIRKEYCDKVQALSQVPMEAEEVARKVEVVSCSIPDDSETERGLNWFKKYIKPILVAGGVDYAITNGAIPGSAGRILIARFKARRFEALSRQKEQLPEPQPIPGQPDYTRIMNEKNEPQGGTVLIGRQALKEYLWALKKGYLDPLDLDRELRIANGDLEEEEDRALSGLFESDEQDIFRLQDLSSPSAPTIPISSSPSTAPMSANVLPPAHTLPPLAPLLLVPYTHPLGSMIWWPQKLYQTLFGEHTRVKEGGELALSLIKAQTREIDPPAAPHALFKSEEMKREWVDRGTRKLLNVERDEWITPKTGSKDLDMGVEYDKYLDKTIRKWPQRIAQHRHLYYKELAERITTARALANGERELTKHERDTKPPLPEDKLMEERLRKEKRWRREEQGWRLVRPGSGIIWQDEFKDALRVFTPPSKSQESIESMS